MHMYRMGTDRHELRADVSKSVRMHAPGLFCAAYRLHTAARLRSVVIFVTALSLSATMFRREAALGTAVRSHSELVNSITAPQLLSLVHKEDRQQTLRLVRVRQLAIYTTHRVSVQD